MNRDTLIQALFDNMSAFKRSMQGHLQPSHLACPISRAQLDLLFTIHQAQPISFKQLAHRLYLTPGAVSQLVEGLESQELVTRHVDERDRRIQCLQVSEGGNAVIREFEQRRRDIMEAISKDLTDTELRIWLRAQEKMIQHFQLEQAETTKKETPRDIQ